METKLSRSFLFSFVLDARALKHSFLRNALLSLTRDLVLIGCLNRFRNRCKQGFLSLSHSDCSKGQDALPRLADKGFLPCKDFKLESLATALSQAYDTS